MDIRSDRTTCPDCNAQLIKEIKKGKRLIGSECGYCRYSDRPFAYGGSQRGECSCEYAETEYVHISCRNCISPRCSTSKKYLKVSGTCTFSDTWKHSTPQQKLELYGTEKLRVLAKRKTLSGYSKYKKDELIQALSHLVTEHDFPI